MYGIYRDIRYLPIYYKCIMVALYIYMYGFNIGIHIILYKIYDIVLRFPVNYTLTVLYIYIIPFITFTQYIMYNRGT